MCQCKIGVDLDGFVEEPKRFLVLVLGCAFDDRQPAKIVVIGIQLFGRLSLGAFDLGLVELGCNCGNHAHGNHVLKIEHIFKRSVELVSPQMRAARGIDQLPGYPDPSSRLADAAFEHITNAESAFCAFIADESSSPTQPEQSITGGEASSPAALVPR